MSYKKKQLIGNIALGIAFTALLGWLGSVPAFCIIGTDFESYEQIFTILFILFLATSIITFIILYLIKYEFDEPIIEIFKKTTKYKLKEKDFKSFYDKFNRNTEKQNYYLAKKYQIFENENIYIYKLPKEEGILNTIVLIKLEEYNKQKIEVIKNKLSEFGVELYGKTMVKDYVKNLNIVCVDKITSEFQRFCC